MRFSYDDATKEFQICGITWPMIFFESMAMHGVWDGPVRILRGSDGTVMFQRVDQRQPGPEIKERSSSPSAEYSLRAT
jgi:hypothetical protein